MAAFGDFHHVSGAGWSVYWRISQVQRQRPGDLVGGLPRQTRDVARHPAVCDRAVSPTGHGAAATRAHV